MTIHITPNNPQYRIVEIFESLQGEGWNTGMPAVFIRLGKCNLACSWCDTDYLKFGMMSLSDILGRLKTYTARNIIITGGEPTIQPHLDALLNALKGEDKILKKVIEEAGETLMASKDGGGEHLVYEVADLWFHTMVLLAHHGLRAEDVVNELARRQGLSGLVEKASRKES